MPLRVIPLLAPIYQPLINRQKISNHQVARTREVFEPIRITSFPLREAVDMFVLLHNERIGRDIPVRTTILFEFPATADLRAARVET